MRKEAYLLFKLNGRAIKKQVYIKDREEEFG